MKRLFTIFLILSGIILPQQPPKYAPGQAIVIFDQIAYSQIQNELLQESIQTSNPDANQLFSTLEVTRLHNILQKDTFDSVEEESGLNRSFVIYLPAYTDSEIEDAVNELKKSYLIEDAFPNTLGYELIEPNDPSFSSQSNLQRIKMPLAWDIQKGSSNIRLAIFDTGFQPTHQEINSKIYLQKDFVDINFADYPNWTFFVNEGEDYHDIDDDATGLRTHGTEVTQVGAAVTNNGYGVAGVGWNTHIVIVRCGFQAIPPGGPLSGYINTSNFINALNWIRSSNSVKVINMSLVLSTSPNSLIQNAITACINAGIVVVAAAGNTAVAPVVYPAAYPGVIAVSGVNSNDINSGWNVGPQLSVVAPANGVWINSNGNTSFGVGTSLSAPLVSGAAALILSQNPNLTPQVVKRVIEASAFKVPGMEGQIFHNYYGYGLLDVYEALRALNSIYVFKNSIMSNDNYGYLVIDNDLNHPVPSNSDLPVKYEADHVSRTDELPFLVNWNSSGTTQKFNKWYQNNSDYNLQLSFMANSQTPPIKDANFNPTVPVSIKNNFPEVGTLNPPTDDIWLKDPWFYYEVSNNWFQSNEFKSYSSPLDIQNNTVGSYGGIFLNHEYDPNGQLPFYKVRSPIQQPYDIFISQTGRNHKFYFGYWSSSGTDPLTQNNIVSGYYETPVVFRSSNAVVNANLKGTQLSNNSSAYNANGQRKAVKLSSGYNPLYNVYESLGKIWLESSTDNGQTWRIENNGQPISGGAGGRCPSITVDQSGYRVAITFQELVSGSTSSKIKILSYYNETQQINPVGEFVINNSSSLDLNPITSLGNDLTIVTTYEQNGTINCQFGFWFEAGYPLIGADWSMFDYQLFGNNYSSPSQVNGIEGITTYYHLASTKNTTYDRADVVYKKFKIQRGYRGNHNVNDPDDAWPVEQIVESIVSQGCSYPYNYLPSISLTNYDKPIISWTAGVWTGGPIYYKRAATRRGPSWGAVQITGTDVNFTNNNSVNSSAEKTVIVWSEGATNPASKWMKRTGTSYITPQNLSHSGIQTQILPGSDYQYMTAMVFNNNALPYYFIKSTTDFSYTPPPQDEGGLSKITDTDTILTYGRSGIVDINSIEFVFNIGDILVGDSIINFIEKPDTLLYSSAEELNQSTRTEDFHLNPNSLFLFTNFYEVVQKANPDTALTENDAVNFKAELVSSTTGNVIGTFDNITYNKNNLNKYASIDYQVDCSGITPGDYYLRLVTTVTGEAKYSLANVVNDNTTLAKKNYNKVNFMGSEIPLTYSLEQNYPNPFNPTTTICYQIPKEGLVTLKVYDILGAEVATLVNEEKVAGKYEVRFDASRLASGVYIYRIKANDFISTKKMVFLK